MMTRHGHSVSRDEQQLQLAEDQTMMSSERTYAGWLRTALTSIAVALGFTALFRDAEVAWVPRAIASIFLVLAIGVLVAADRRAAAVQRKLNHHFVSGASPSTRHLITWGAVMATLCLMATIWLLL